MRFSFNVNISKMKFKDLNKYISLLCKTYLNGNKKEDKPDPEEKVIE